MSNFKELLEALEISEKLISSKDNVIENKGIYLFKEMYMSEITGLLINYAIRVDSKKKEIEFIWNKNNYDSFKKFLNKKFKGHLTITNIISNGSPILRIKGSVNSMIELLSQRNEIIDEFLSKKT